MSWLLIIFIGLFLELAIVVGFVAVASAAWRVDRIVAQLVLAAAATVVASFLATFLSALLSNSSETIRMTNEVVAALRTGAMGLFVVLSLVRLARRLETLRGPKQF